MNNLQSRVVPSYWQSFRFRCATVARVFLVALGLASLFWLLSISLLWGAQAAEKSGNSKAQDVDAEYNFKWLDPDKKIYVLQNRRYRKASRAHVSLLLGVAVGGVYRNTFNIDGRVGYSFSETLGFEVFYNRYFNRANNASQALSASSATSIPVIREIDGAFGGLFLWSPWYAKINVFNQILYFDWYFSVGAGRLQTVLDTNTVVGNASVFVNEDLTAFFIGTGHQYHLNHQFFVRLDFMGAVYRALSFGTSGAKTWFSNYNFHVGAGVRL